MLPAPALEPLKPCYVSVQTAKNVYVSETVLLRGSGFAANQRVRIDVDGQALREADTAADGTLDTQVSAPVAPVGASAFRVTVTPANPEYGLPVSADSRVTNLSVRLRPRLARPRQLVRFRGRGFTDGGAVYAHYLRRGRLLKTIRLVKRPTPPCGRFAVFRRQFPFTPKQGTYLVQFDQHRRLTGDGPLVKLTIDVRRRPKTG